MYKYFYSIIIIIIIILIIIFSVKKIANRGFIYYSLNTS